MTRVPVVRAAAAVALAASGCLGSALTPQPDPTRFFVLTATTAVGAGAADAPASAAGPRSVGLGPLELPEYLLRPELVARVGPTELAAAYENRWAEPLDRNVLRVLASELRVATGLPEVRIYPWFAQDAPAVQVVVEVDRFERVDERDAVVLAARWTLLDPRDPAVPPVHGRTDAALEVPSEPERVVAAMSTALARLAADIAAELARTRR